MGEKGNSGERKDANREIGVPGAKEEKDANREIDVPGVKEEKDANLEIGVPGERNGVPGWHSRGYLPHFENSEAIQHVTFHLADSLPKAVLLRLESELKVIPEAKRDVERRRRLAAWSESGHRASVFRVPPL